MKKIHSIIVLTFLLVSCTGMKGLYEKERSTMLEGSMAQEILFTDSLVAHLPSPIKKYLKVSGYMGKPVPFNCEVHWSESFIKLKPENEWGGLNTTQFNSIDPIGRISFMKFASMPLKGRDIYIDGQGEMKGKLVNLFTVVEGSGPEVSQSAMITAFAEFPIITGYLLESDIEWMTVDSNTVSAKLSEGGFEVTGYFHFDEQGFYRRFETNDRFYANPEGGFEKIPYKILIHSYKEQGDLMIPESMSAHWNLPESDFKYFKGKLDRLEFNITK